MSALPVCRVVLLCALAASSCSGRRVLMVQMVHTGSHVFVMRSLAAQLVQRGHQVTQLRWLTALSSLVPLNDTAKTDDGSGHVEVISRRIDNADRRFGSFDTAGVFQPIVTSTWQHEWSLTIAARHLMEVPHAYCSDLLADTALLSEMRLRRFDVAIVDVFTSTCGVAFTRALGLPTVGFYVVLPVGGEHSQVTGLLNLPSLVVSALSRMRPPLTGIWRRLYNTAALTSMKLAAHYVMAVCDVYIRRYQPSLPSSAALLQEMDVALYNSHFLTRQPLLLPPNLQAIGCVQCGLAAPLPERLERFFSGSGRHGVIVFSVGITLYDPQQMPAEFVGRLLGAFGQLRQRVAMRLHRAAVRDLHVPENVLLLDWLPQRDALRHQRTRLFVSHCGMGGLMESVYAGVPLVCLPFFGDQPENAQFVAYRGYGRALDTFAVGEAELLAAVREVLHNSSYGKAARRAARLWRAEGETAVDRVEGWVERLARRGRPGHLQLRDGHLGWLRYFLLDIFLAVAVTAATVTWLSLAIRKRTAQRRL